MDVFLSYARTSGRPYAEAVFRELGGEAASLAFLDTEDIEHSDRFPKRLIDALLASRIVVIFADPIYFTRWYCILEFRAARAPFDYLAERAGTSPEERASALESILIVLPKDGARSLDMWNLPPGLQQINWPTVNDPSAVATQIRCRLNTALPTLAERIEETIGAEKFRREWLDVSRLPTVEFISADIPFAPVRGLPSSLHERFVGRADDLWRIHDTLVARRGEVQTAAARTGALEGGAGIGKSRLALEYLYRFGPRYFPGGLFWIDAERTLEPQYYQVALALNPATPDWKTVQKESGGISDRLVSEFRALPPERPALVIIDNIPEPNPGELPKSLDEWFPAAGFVSMLITSRSRVSLGAGGSVVPLQVDVLDIDAAQVLLTQGIDSSDIEAAAWHEIGKWVGNLPLALELLNRALATKALSASELLTRARSTATTVLLDQAMDALRAVVPANSLRGASEALVVSYERLPERAKAAARLIAWLAPAPVPDALLDALSVKLFDASVRSILVARSFVIETYSASLPMFGAMHRVLGDFLRTKSEDQKNELTVLTNALLNLMSEERIRSLSELPLLDSCVPHAFTLLRHVAVEQPRTVFIEHTAAIALPLCFMLLEQDLTTAASDLALEALMACSVESEPGQLSIQVEIPAVGALVKSLPEVLRRTGQYDVAEQIQRIYLSWLEQQCEADDEEVLVERDNLALTLRDRGSTENLVEAKRILEGTLSIWKQRDPVSLDTLTALNNLALVEQKRGDSEHAAALFEEVLQGLRHHRNVEMEMIKTMMSLAGSLWETNPDRACELLEEALAIADRKGLPDRHWVTLDLLKQLGGRSHRRGDFKKSKPLLRRAVQALAAIRGDDAAETTIFAWALFDSEIRTADTTAATVTRERYLDWLLVTADEQLTSEQQRIRADIQTRDRL